MNSIELRSLRLNFLRCSLCFAFSTTWLADRVYADAFDHGHTAFSKVLQHHVQGAKVDYASLKENPAGLNAYLDSLAAVDESQFKAWTENQQISFLINLYNAATLKLIIDHYPVKSIKDIGSLFSSPWKRKEVRLFGKKETLDHIEHGLLRKKYIEPRIHFAVNCASIGCPNLRAEAFTADQLDEQLDEQGKAFLSDRSRNRLENGVLYLSPIFDWFSEDFKESGGVAKFVAPYLPEADQETAAAGKVKIKYTKYDWSLNKS